MDAELVRWAVTGLMGFVMWFGKRTLDSMEKNVAINLVAIDQLKADVQMVKRDYLHRDDFKEFKQELRDLFNEIKQDIKELKPHAS